MKIFCFNTTTSDKWELCPSSHIVFADTLEKAEENLKDMLKNTNSKETIDSFYEIRAFDNCIYTIQNAVVE